MNTKFSILLVALAQGLTGLAQAADDEGLKFSWSGFGQFTAAKVLSGKTGSYQQWQCPCALQNWEYVGAYEKAKGWQADQESLLGLQGTVRVNDRLSGTVQLLSRPNNNNYRPSVDWAYVTYALSDEWTLQAGRKRIPLFYYSDFLYVGTVYPWVRPTPNVYGWPIYAYDGANLAYSTSVIGNWTLDANAWAGNFSYKNNPNITKIYYTDPTDEKWRNILGAYATLSNGEISARLMLMTFRNDQSTHKPDGTTVLNLDGYKSTIAALSLNYDGRNNVIVRSELNRYSQKVSGNTYNFLLLGGGYKWGDWTGMYTISGYRSTENAFAIPIEGRRTQTLTLRWDVSKNWVLKAQFDISKDESKYDFFGDHKLMSFSAQTSF